MENLFANVPGFNVVKTNITKVRGGKKEAKANGMWNERPAIIFEARPETEEKKAYRMLVNRKAAELLNLTIDGTDRLEFGILERNNQPVLAVAVVTENSEDNDKLGYKVGKNSTFSNQKLHKSTLASFNMSSDSNNIFVLEATANPSVFIGMPLAEVEHQDSLAEQYEASEQYYNAEEDNTINEEPVMAEESGFEN